MSFRERNTGFPDSFCGHRNTCRPHPDAIVSPHATITEDDIAVTRAIARHRLSFQVSRDRARALAETGLVPPPPDPDHHGGPISDQIYCASPVMMDDSSSTRSRNVSTIGRLALSSLRGAELTRNLGGSDHGRHDEDSLHSGGSSAENSPVRTSAPRPSEGGGPRKEKRRRSFLSRLTHR